MLKVDKRLFPVKAHYFLFMAGMGPVLPFLPVIGKQLGVSVVAMGLINGTLPLFYILAKPLFGYLLDKYSNFRKHIFISLIALTSIFFMFIIVVCKNSENQILRCQSVEPCQGNSSGMGALCSWVDNGTLRRATFDPLANCINEYNCTKACPVSGEMSVGAFWSFLILMALGTVGFNVSNSISDAICFDVLGDGEQAKFGQQRVWGAIGFGVTALLGGLMVESASSNELSKDYMSAFIVGSVCILLDVVLCCRTLELPPFPKSENICKDVTSLIKVPRVRMFLCFTIIVGMCDAAIMYYLLWFLEDLASMRGNSTFVNLLEGLTIAAETLFGEVVSFHFAGKVISKVGYGNSLTIAFVFYFLRLGLISSLHNPWFVLPIEIFMQGPSYALGYSTIVAYASKISPPGTSATMQGVVAGMDDGLGYFLGNLLASVVYKRYGGNVMFLMYSFIAGGSGVAHHYFFSKFKKQEKEDDEKRDENQELSHLQTEIPRNETLADDVFV